MTRAFRFSLYVAASVLPLLGAIAPAERWRPVTL